MRAEYDVNYVIFFFFQAEDGIRDLTVTGVQTCALPICNLGGVWAGRHALAKGLGWLLSLRRAGIPVRRGVRGLRAIGREQVERVVWDEIGRASCRERV